MIEREEHKREMLGKFCEKIRVKIKVKKIFTERRKLRRKISIKEINKVIEKLKK